MTRNTVLVIGLLACAMLSCEKPDVAPLPPVGAPEAVTELQGSVVKTTAAWQVSYSWTNPPGTTKTRCRVNGGSWLEFPSPHASAGLSATAGERVTFEVQAGNGSGWGPAASVTNSI